VQVIGVGRSPANVFQKPETRMPKLETKSKHEIRMAETSGVRRGRWWPLWRVARVFLVAYLVVLVLVMLFEENLIFFPSKYPDGDWAPHGLHIEDAQFTAADGTKLHGWYVPHDNPIAHVLFFHGNAGNLTHRIDVLRELYHHVGAAVLIVDYRGYGKSDGKPNEQGVLQDGRAARKWLAERAGVAESEIVLMGRSLGSGVAVDLTTDVTPRALILENAFTSMPDVAAVHYPFLPVHLAMRTRLDSKTKIAGYAGPLLQSHGTEDEVIPFQLGQQLYEACPSGNKQFLPFEGMRHNDFHQREYYNAMRAFLKDLP
jgi:uncharacterized protein